MIDLSKIVVSIIIPFMMIVIGFWFYKAPPQEINKVVGYRSRMSMINENTWKFAHAYSSILLLKFGLGLMFFSILITCAFAQSKNYDTVALILTLLQVIALFAVTVMTELTLHKHFDENGNPKEDDYGNMLG